MKMNKYNLLAVAVSTALLSGAVLAESGTDVLKDGWEVHGYLSSNLRSVDGASIDTEFGRNEYQTAGTHGKSTNQVEFTVKKHTEHANGSWSNLVVKAEYGDGNSYAYSSAAAQKDNSKAQLEVKEAYVELGALPYLGEDTSIWAGQRYLNRSAGLLSGEFWKQSSGVGAGIQSKIAGNTAGFAVVMADADINATGDYDARQTLSSYNFYYYGVDVGIGRLDFDLKYMTQANIADSDQKDGLGGSITLNSSYYGLDGWAQTAIAYGEGVASNRGVNFGNWSGAHGDDKEGSLFLTSYGVLNISEKWQLGTEATYFAGAEKFYGSKGLKRYLVAARPSYKVNDNLRLEGTASYGHQEVDEGFWGKTGDAVENDIINLEVAAALTMNSDYFGRPQIKPYVSYIKADDDASASSIGIKGGDSEVIVGVHTEIWY